jgi:peptidoglycan/xylan/chitin deacetylase (PgdA/CDA1 family)
VIHFDDCYKGVFTNAAPLLKSVQMPATAFIASGYVGKNLAFPHDAEAYPFTFENLEEDEVLGLKELGFEIGAHTVQHLNLGEVSMSRVQREVLGSRAHLEAITGQPVEFFSYPFGGRRDVSEEVREIVRSAGFKALFSAHGGTVGKRTDLFDIPRSGASSEHRPLDLMMEVEDLDLNTLLSRIRRTTNGKRPLSGSMVHKASIHD